MKKVIYFICYVVGMVIGVSLLIFNYETLDREPSMLRYTMMAAGIFFIIPGIIQLITSLNPKKDENGNILPRKWYTTVIAVVALLWGIYILLFPMGYNNDYSITLGVSLAVVGLAQAVWIVRTSESTFLRFIVPCVTVVLGVLVCTVFNSYPDNGKSAQLAAILSGIMLLVWGVNGFFSLRSKRVVAAADKAAHLERKAEKEERKAAKLNKTSESEGIAPEDEEKREKTEENLEENRAKEEKPEKKEEEKETDKSKDSSSEVTTAEK